MSVVSLMLANDQGVSEQYVVLVAGACLGTSSRQALTMAFDS